MCWKCYKCSKEKFVSENRLLNENANCYTFRNCERIGIETCWSRNTRLFCWKARVPRRQGIWRLRVPVTAVGGPLWTAVPGLGAPWGDVILYTGNSIFTGHLTYLSYLPHLLRFEGDLGFKIRYQFHQFFSTLYTVQGGSQQTIDRTIFRQSQFETFINKVRCVF